MSISRGMHGEDVVYIHNGITKEQNKVICSNLESVILSEVCRRETNII